MSAESLPADLPPEGMYRVYHVRFGVGYNGWYLVAGMTPGDTAARIEFAFLPLDPESSGIPEITPDFDVVNIQTGIWRERLDTEIGQRIRGLHDRIEAWGRVRGLPDQPRPDCHEVSQGELRSLGFRTLPMPDDDPFLKVWRDGLERLREWTRCPALREDLRGLGWKERVSRLVPSGRDASRAQGRARAGVVLCRLASVLVTRDLPGGAGSRPQPSGVFIRAAAHHPTPSHWASHARRTSLHHPGPHCPIHPDVPADRGGVDSDVAGRLRVSATRDRAALACIRSRALPRLPVRAPQFRSRSGGRSPEHRFGGSRRGHPSARNGGALAAHGSPPRLVCGYARPVRILVVGRGRLDPVDNSDGVIEPAPATGRVG